MKFNSTLGPALMATITFLLITACKTVDIKDGRVPSQYLSEAQKLAGTYKGSFNRVPGNLTISFQGDKPVVAYHNSHGDDILNNNCHSSFGNLLQVTVKEAHHTPYISNADFDFDAGDCSLMVSGRDISLDFKQTDQGITVNLSLLMEIRQHQVCSWAPGNPPNIPPTQNCTLQQDPVYLGGHFVRSTLP
ncbi:MAG: hypothetical protein ACXWRE_08120 [Pseudobdellovibrionaceae bacterium]